MLRLIIWCRPFSKYLLVAWLLTMIIVSSTPNIPTLRIHTAKAEIRLDYIMHFCEYGFLAFMTFLTFAGSNFKISSRKFILLTICLLLFAVLDEYHQKLIPGRSFNAMDILSNITGIFAAVIFTLIVFGFVVRLLKKRN